MNSNFAQESNTVHKTGNETVNGDKYLTGYIRHTLTYDCIQSTAFDVRTDPEADRGRDIFRFWEGDRSSLGDYLGGMSYYQQTDGSSRLQLICFGYPTTGNPSQQRINFHAYRDGTGSFYPVRNNVNLGTSAYQWKSIYAKDYYYNGTAWGLDKRNIWTNINDFNALSLYNNSVTYNEAPSSNVELPSIRIFGGGKYCGAFDYVWKSSGENVIRLSLGSHSSGGTFGYWSCNFGVPRDFSDGGKFGTPAFYPNNDNGYNLGDSTHRWKTFNGINPGALCFPEGTTNNANTTFNPDLTNWLKDGTDFTITAQVTGWLHIRIQNSTGNFAWVKRASAGDNQTWCIVGDSNTNATIPDIAINVPVVQSYTYTLKIKSSRLSAAIFMCLGDV